MKINRNLKTLNNKTGKKIISTLSTMCFDHEKYKNCYFWKNTGNAANRRSQEFEQTIVFTLNDVEYEWVQYLTISCRNFYWTSKIYKNGVKTNIKTIRKLIG